METPTAETDAEATIRRLVALQRDVDAASARLDAAKDAVKDAREALLSARDALEAGTRSAGDYLPLFDGQAAAKADIDAAFRPARSATVEAGEGMPLPPGVDRIVIESADYPHVAEVADRLRVGPGRDRTKPAA